ncbi:MAG TPA: TetR family transcriptional regulator [Mycobacteriales bacterium]|nr:TetR family transcriptional regulator [Mycobacteriales bacterium]
MAESRSGFPARPSGAPNGAARGTRDALLDAAYDAAVAGDWARVRMADVARAAGLSRQTLYNEFGSKDALAQALALREVERFIDGTERVLDEAHPAGPIQAVAAAALSTLQRAADNPLLKAALVDDSSGLLSYLTTRGEPAIAAARTSFQNYYSTHWPHLSPDAIALAADTITRLTVSYIVLPPDAPAETIAGQFADLARKLLGEDPS